MPATYTYNDALDDAKVAVMAAFEDAGSNFDGATSDQSLADLIIDIGKRLTALKRPSRRPRS